MSHFTLGVVNVGGGECRGGECRTIAANAVRVNFLAECKKNSRGTRKLLFCAPFYS